jgi:GT2 family glycosyltransferase
VRSGVDAVIVRWRGGDEVRRCLGTLLANGGPRLNSVVLVDSGSGDGGAERLAAEFPDIQVVALEHNLGFAYAADRGAGESSEPLLLLLNPDTEVPEGAIETLASSLDGRPDTAGIVPLLEGLDGVSQHRWQLRRFPDIARLALGLSGAPAFSSPPTAPAGVDQPAAAAWLVRRNVWEALGGLDPTFEPAWWEDVDFCVRLRERLEDPVFPVNEGFVVDPSATLCHLGGSSIADLGRTAFFAAYYTNLLHYTARHHPGRLGLIRKSLGLVLRGKMLLQPGQRDAYRAALETVRTATPRGQRGSPPRSGGH